MHCLPWLPGEVIRINDPQVTIRAATRSDVTELVSLLHQLFSIERDFTPDPEKQRRGLELLIDSNQAQLFVAEKNSQVVAMVSAQIIISTAEGGPVGLIEDVVVHEACRGEGIGKAILEYLRRWSELNGLTRLQLLADQTNVQAIDFYRSNGWILTGLVGLRHKVQTAD